MRQWIHPYREQALEQLSFLEAEKAALAKAAPGEKILLPVYTPRLIQYMKTGNEDVIPATLFYEGIVILLAADPEFKQAEEYIHLLSQEKELLKHLKESATVVENQDGILGASYHMLILDLEPERVESLIYLLMQYHGANNKEALQDVLQKILQINPEQIKTDDLELIASFCIQEQQYDDATHVFAYLEDERKSEMSDEAKTMAQEFRVQQHQSKMEEALNRQDFSGAMRIYDEIALQDRKGIHYFLYGEAQQGLGHFPQSIVSLTKAIEEGVDRSDAFNDLSIAYYLSQQVDQAYEVARQGLERYPDNEKLLYNLLVFLLQLEEVEEAKNIFHVLQTMELKDEEIQSNVAQLSQYFEEENR